MAIDSGMVMVPMLLVLTVSIAYNIHVYSCFRRRFLIHGLGKQAVKETVGETGWPMLFSALTTFASLLSFLAIPIRPMRFVGIASFSCVMLSFLFSVTLMPILLSSGKDGKPRPKVQETGGRWMDRKLESLGKSVLRHDTLILWLTGIIFVVLIYQFTKIGTAFDIERAMEWKIDYVNNLLEVGKGGLGSVYTYDVMINFPEDGLAKFPTMLLQSDSLAQHAGGYKLTRRTTSVLNVLKDLNQTLHDDNPFYYTIPHNPDEVTQLLLLYENAGGNEAEYWIDYDCRRLRLMVEVDSYNSGKTERELGDIITCAQRLFLNVAVATVRSIPQFTVMMQYIARGQVVPFAISLLIIGILMMIVFGSVHIGLVGLIPNITPALVVGGPMGWPGYPSDIMTATIILMILGLAVDDIIHFINRSHLGFDHKGNYRNAILRSFHAIGTPIVLTSIVVCVNFAIYTTSEGLSFVHVDILSMTEILLALLADLFVTPMLIQKFRLFGKETSTIERPKEQTNIIES